MNDDFKNGILSLNTRQFGLVAEILIKFINRQGKSGSLNYDLIEGNSKIEVKTSRVYKKK